MSNMLVLISVFVWAFLLEAISATSNSTGAFRNRTDALRNRTGRKIPLLQQRRLVYDGRLLSPAEWSSQYDFVVRVGTGSSGCTGSAWGNKVLTAAHCGDRNDDPSAYRVVSVYGEFQVSKIDIHPDYQPGVNQAVDYMVLTLTTSIPNKQKVAFKGTDLPVGANVMIAGLGGTGGTNPNHRPVLSDSMQITSSCYSYPLMCYAAGAKGGCAGDSGGPVFYWDDEQCDADSWPKSRSCAIGLGGWFGTDQVEADSWPEARSFVDGTGTWCSSAHGSQKQNLHDAMSECLHGEYQGMKAPCIGVVFNGPQPGDEGSADGKYTTCWRTTSTGLGWQVLLKPVQGIHNSGCRAELYQHGDFGGWKTEFPPGDYEIGEFLGRGGRNDDASAIKVIGSNCVAELYEHGDFTGWKAIFHTGDYDFDKFVSAGAKNDGTSAIKVFKVPVPATAVVAGALSGKTNTCGHPESRDHFASTSGAMGWIKSVAPNFQWTP